MPSTETSYFQLYSQCIPVNGSRRSIICDTQRGGFDFIPNGLFEILDSHKYLSISEIKEIYGDEQTELIDEYFDFLLNNEYGFWCDKADSENFPDLDLKWDTPANITNAIIDLDSNSSHDFSSIFSQLEDLGCFHIQIRCYTTKKIEYWNEIMALVLKSRIQSVDIFTAFEKEYTKEKLDELLNRHLRLRNFIIHSTPSKIEISEQYNSNQSVLSIADQINADSHCGIVHPAYFSINLQTFSEAQQLNTCLNKKLSINVDGEIMNCPSLKRSFGNVQDTKLKEAVYTNSFRKIWSVSKNQIDVCRDCEFRYICTDCRAYTKDPSNHLSKPAKCSYDPYSGKWGDDNSSKNSLYKK